MTDNPTGLFNDLIPETMTSRYNLRPLAEVLRGENLDNVDAGECKLCHSIILGSEIAPHARLHRELDDLRQPLTSGAAFAQARELLDSRARGQQFYGVDVSEAVALADGWRRLGESLSAWERGDEGKRPIPPMDVPPNWLPES